MPPPQKLFVVDVESDGLYVSGFACAAVVYENGVEVAHFVGIAEMDKVENPWVRTHVLPHLHALPCYETKLALRESFWAFWEKHRENALCIADYGAPVESFWFRECILDDARNRTWNGPFPLHDVATLLYTKGIEPTISRQSYSGYGGTAHNPLDDARASALTWIKATLEN